MHGAVIENGETGYIGYFYIRCEDNDDVMYDVYSSSVHRTRKDVLKEFREDGERIKKALSVEFALYAAGERDRLFNIVLVETEAAIDIENLRERYGDIDFPSDYHARLQVVIRRVRVFPFAQEKQKEGDL